MRRSLDFCQKVKSRSKIGVGRCIVQSLTYRFGGKAFKQLYNSEELYIHSAILCNLIFLHSFGLSTELDDVTSYIDIVPILSFSIISRDFLQQYHCQLLVHLGFLQLP